MFKETEQAFAKKGDPREDLESLQGAIKAIEVEIEAELAIDQEQSMFSFVRPCEQKVKVNPGHQKQLELLNLFFKGDVPEEIKNSLDDKGEAIEIVPRVSVMSLSSTESIRVLSLVRTIYKEQEAALLEKLNG